MTKLLLFILFFPLFSFSQIFPARQYRLGDVFRYRLTVESFRGDKPAGKSIAVSQHMVVQDSGFLAEEIRWISKMNIGTKDTVFLDSIAQKIPSYRISLSPKGSVLLPPLKTPEMTGDITDLNTFYVAIAAPLHARELSDNNKSFLNKDLVNGNFADGTLILYGVDCMETSQRLVSHTKDYTVVETKFTPPSTPHLQPLTDSMERPIFEHPINFQMKQKSVGDKVNLLWGNESFTIITKIDAHNGQILESFMVNTLNLMMRYNASPDLVTYAAELPISIRRVLKLELVK